jgi:hypothetical protein
LCEAQRCEPFFVFWAPWVRVIGVESKEAEPSVMRYQLAQVNIARMRGGADEPVMAGLVSRIAEMNALADGSPGFAWRLPGSDATAEALGVFDGYFVPFEPKRLFYNLSVWNTVEDLQRYVFRTEHAQMLRMKHDWIENSDPAHLAMWWIAAGTLPTIAESSIRLRALDERGPTPFSFTFSTQFSAPGGV